MPTHKGLLPRATLHQRGELRRAFSGLHLRTHPDANLAAAQLLLVHADEIMLLTGQRVTGWDNIPINIAAAGAGGLDTGAEASDAWYEAHAIYKPAGGVKNAILHRAKVYTQDAVHDTGIDGTHSLRTGATTNIKLAQGFKVGNAGFVPFVDARLIRAGSPVGNIWFTIEGDAAGVPDGTPLATSDKINAALLSTATRIRVPFRVPASLSADPTQYHLVLQGDYATSGANNIGWRADTTAAGYLLGSKAAFDGTTWTTDADDDFAFWVFVTTNDSPLVVPAGYVAGPKIGYVYNDSASALKFMAAVDRHVMVGSSENDSGNIGVSTHTLLSLAEFIPPVPVIGHFSIALTGGAGAIAVGNIQANDADAATAGRTWKHIRADSGTTVPASAVPPIALEYQAAVVDTATNGGRVWLEAYTW